MSATLSTHVLDTVSGRPAAGIAVRLLRGGERLFLGATDSDGRCRGFPPLPSGGYRLEFDVAAYFREAGVALADPPFLDTVALEFGVADGAHHHVPLLVSPFGYTTYRGS